MGALVAHDPRGEVEVHVFRPGTEQVSDWAHAGMVGTASVSRQLEIARAQMRANPAILLPDPAFYAGAQMQDVIRSERYRSRSA